MSYRLVAEGPYEQVVEYEDLPTLPHGAKVKFELETATGFAYLADIWGDEWVMNKFAVEGVTITDSYSTDSSHVMCRGYVNSPGLPVILTLIGVIIAIAGVAYIIRQIKVWVDEGVLPPLPDIFTPKNVAILVGVGMAGTLAYLMLREVTR